jgi:hypothetical protein
MESITEAKRYRHFHVLHHERAGKKKIAITTVGYDPWSDPGVEAQRVEEKLGLRTKTQ